MNWPDDYLVRFTSKSSGKHADKAGITREDILRVMERRPAAGWCKNGAPGLRWEGSYPGRWKRFEVIAYDLQPDRSSGSLRIALVAHVQPDYGKGFKPWPTRATG